MSPSAINYTWFQGNELRDAYCMTYIKGVPPVEFLARLGVTRYPDQQGLGALASTYWGDPQEPHDPWQFIGATEVPGRDGPWTLAVEINGFIGNVTEYMGPASAGTRILSHYQNAKGGNHFNWWENGERRTLFEWPWQRRGNTPDDLVEAMTQVGFDLDPKGEDPGVLGKFALAEKLSGVRVTADLLSHSPYVTGYVGHSPSKTPTASERPVRGSGPGLRPVVGKLSTGRESPQSTRRTSMRRGLGALIPPSSDSSDRAAGSAVTRAHHRPSSGDAKG